MLAFSAAALPINALITPNTISIAGSSTVLPIATGSISDVPNLLELAWLLLTPVGDTTSALDINTMNIQA